MPNRLHHVPDSVPLFEGRQPSGTRVVACTGAATAAPIGVPARVDAVAAMADSVPEDEDAGYFGMYSESDVGARGDASMADSDDEDVGAARKDPCADSDDEDSDDENSDDEGLPAAPPAREDSDGSSSDSDDEDDSNTDDEMSGMPPVRDEFSGEQINTMMRLLQARDLDSHTVDAAVGGLISSMDTSAKEVALRVPTSPLVSPARSVRYRDLGRKTRAPEHRRHRNTPAGTGRPRAGTQAPSGAPHRKRGRRGGPKSRPAGTQSGNQQIWRCALRERSRQDCPRQF